MRIEEWKGDWALVTGASSGIGREFCVQLAATGMNLVMVARRGARLADLAHALQLQHATKSVVIEQDLGLPGAATAVKQRADNEGIAVRLLINNAAFGPWGPFENTTAEIYERLVHLVAATPIAMCRLFLPDLASFPSGAIINLSSPAALQPIPYKAVYSAAKSCLHNFSLALYEEWHESGVTVLTAAPIRTGFGREWIEQALPYQLGARTKFEIVPGGINCVIDIPAEWCAADGAAQISRSNIDPR